MSRETNNRTRARCLPPAYELAAFSVFGFCVAHGLSRSLFYRMLRAGEGPRVMKCGSRTLISVEAARAWRGARERTAAVSRRRYGGHRIRKPRARHRVGDRASRRARRH